MAHDDRTHVTGPTADEATSPLVHSRDLDHFKIPDGDPDPRGWDVKTSEGRDLGKVADLLVDTATGQVRYLELAVDKDVVKDGARDFYLIPVGEARLNDDHDDVVVNLSAAELAGVPAYERGRVSREYERSLRSYVRERPGRQRAADVAAATGAAATGAAATGAAATGAAAMDRDADFYRGAEYDDRSFFGSRRAARGGLTGAAARTADRVADVVDDTKDRIDGNPASRPGRDATDRPGR
jgi:hypothetical protein